ncbi:hypothetical protein J7337_000271 [Fusarium musae]|uniref:Uncharacterized protein n=1 Tax=Fusarium musae TaxID=1042133 RepID=A0A9P8IUW8_9HYPO|nr:hypothetical protein J7337_000271 [Fusarium musae]KAG9506734.1 hypothetical protein J7337_000271 [Fusarium musae]
MVSELDISEELQDLAEPFTNAGLCGENLWLTILETCNDGFERMAERLVDLPEVTKVCRHFVRHLSLVIIDRGGGAQKGRHYTNARHERRDQVRELRLLNPG